MEVVLDDPAAIDRAPHDVDRLVWWQTFRGPVNARADERLRGLRFVVGQRETFRRGDRDLRRAVGGWAICRVRKDPASTGCQRRGAPPPSGGGDKPPRP